MLNRSRSPLPAGVSIEAWLHADACLRNPGLWYPGVRRPSWVPPVIGNGPKFYRRAPTTWGDPAIWLPLQMAITRVQKKANAVQSTNTNAVTLDNPTTTGNTLIVSVAAYYPDSVYTLSIDDGPHSTWELDIDYQPASNGSIYLWHASNIVGQSSHVVTVSASGADYYIVEVVEYSGLKASGAGDQALGHLDLATTSFSSGNVTTVDATELLFGTLHLYSTSATVTPDTGWAEIHRLSDGSFHEIQIAERFVSATGSYAYSGSVSASLNIGSVITTYKAAAAASGLPLKSLVQLQAVKRASYY